MAKALLICFRDNRTPDFEPLLGQLSERLTPDNLVVNLPYCHRESGVLAYIHHPTPTVRTHRASFCLGLASSADIFRPGSPRPDGTFALFRVGGDGIEVLSDYTASRTIWYCLTTEFLAVSTSQRMIVTFLGDFRPNPAAARWMVWSGAIGQQSWDERLRAIPPNSSLVLDRARWDLRLERGGALAFTPDDRPDAWHKRRLGEAVEKAVHDFEFEPGRWALALSGGMDSRSLLRHLSGGHGLHTVTWGLRASLDRPDSDAAIARRLAQVCRLPHQYFATDADQTTFATIVTRFLVAGEGRIDHLHGYMDGLGIWASLSAGGRGIIRGYDAFGRKPPVRSAYQARRASALLVTTDYASPSMLPAELTLSESDIPIGLRRGPHESLHDWRDRLWLEFRTPCVTAALDDVKTAYVEIVNPLLCREVVEVVQHLPVALREDKIVFQEIVGAMFPEIPFASRDAIQETDEIFGLPSMTIALRDSLLVVRPNRLLPPETIDWLVGQLRAGVTRSRLRRRLIVAVKAHAPRFIENYFRARLRSEPLNSRRLAWRCLIVSRMEDLLADDARVGASRYSAVA